MAANDAKLIALVEANTKGFENALKRIEKSTNAAFKGGTSNVVRFDRATSQAAVSAGKLDTALAKANVTAGRLSTLGRGLAGGIIGSLGVGAVLSLGGAIGKARDALASFDQIAKSARTTGLTPEFFQALSFAAVETGISQETLNSSLLIFAKNSGLAAQGSGALASGLKKTHPELLKAIQLAKTQDERLRLVAEAMRAAGTAAQRAALSSIAFGRGGLELTEIFGGGAAALDDFARRAQKYGFIIGRDVLEEADKLDDKLSVLAKVIDINLNVALFRLGPLLVEAAAGMAAFSKSIRDASDEAASGDIEGFITTLMTGTPGTLPLLDHIRDFNKQMDETAATLATATGQVQQFLDALGASPEMRRLVTDEQIAELERLRELLAKGTPDAAQEAREALAKLAGENPRFGALAEKLNPLIDALIETKDAAGDARKAIELLNAEEFIGPPQRPPVTFRQAEEASMAAWQPTADFLSGRTAEAQLSEFDRALEHRTDVILKKAEELGHALSEAGARIQAKSELAIEAARTSTLGAVGDFVNEVVGVESGGDPFAKNPASSATGLGQFITETWVRLFKQEFPDRAKNLSNEAIAALRTEGETSKALILAYARENAAVLQAAGVSVDKAALHLAHFLGAGDAVKVLNAAPGTPLAGLITPASIAANPTILGGGKTVDDAILYAQGRTDMAKADVALASAKNDLIAGIEREIAALGLEAEAFGKSTFEAERAQVAFDLLEQAKAAGLEITPELSATINELADRYAAATVKVGEFAAAQEAAAEAQAFAIERMDSFRDAAKDVLGGFISDLRDGKSASEALGNALDRIVDKLVDSTLDTFINSLLGQRGTAGGGLLGGLFAGIFHGGGIAGQASMHRLVPAAAFANAPRYHSGTLRAGEVPAILQKGEIVLPKMMRSAGAGGVQERMALKLDVDVNPSPLFATTVQQRVVETVADNNRRVPDIITDQRRRRG